MSKTYRELLVALAAAPARADVVGLQTGQEGDGYSGGTTPKKEVVVLTASGPRKFAEANVKEVRPSADAEADFQRYFKSATPAMPVQGPGGAQGGAAPVGEQAPQGVTAQQSIDPAVSPSSSMSLSPQAHMQRAQALGRGGEMNV